MNADPNSQVDSALPVSPGVPGVPGVRLECDGAPVVNYTLWQNGIPLIRSLFLVNDTDEDLEGLDLQLRATPAFLLPLRKRLDYIPAHSRCAVRDLNVILDADYLSQRSEKERGFLYMTLESCGRPYAQLSLELTILAFDEWTGSGFCPELLTSFVTPNHPDLSRVLSDAAALLEQWTGDPSLDAYQSQDPNRVLMQAAAVFGAIQRRNIVYAVHPASFEQAGQRVRLCERILRGKMGNCLDLSLLYASCLEAMGLHPLLILTQGHVFAGLWLSDQSFPEAVQDDVSMLTKRLADGIHEIAVVECTFLCAASGPLPRFDEAQRQAELTLHGPDPVEVILDVFRARLSGITPLPLRVAGPQSDGAAPRRAEDSSRVTAAPALERQTLRFEDWNASPIPGAPAAFAGEARFSRKVQWERKLLDLGLRNALINLRLSRTLIPILCVSLDSLEDALADGHDLSIHPCPREWQQRQAELSFETLHELGAAEELIEAELRQHRLRSALSETALTNARKLLYRNARSAMEENGANTLYLALGLLRWYEQERSQKAHYAPLILLPVELLRKSAAEAYVLRLRDDEPQMNVTLLEMLKQEFAIDIPGLDPLPVDAHGLDIRRVLTLLRQAVMGQARWDILESAYLGTFSFSQFVMWNDIRNRSEDLAGNAIVRSLMKGRLCWEAEAMEIGDRVPEDAVFLPLPADASQLYAIEAACRGQSFVLHGPPGTGKSQTITTLIANALAQGRTVLFVAEKRAALEVVHRRLQKIALDPFCLELHSNKARKRDVLEQLRKASEISQSEHTVDYARKARQLHELRQELDGYAGALHARRDCGLSLYELIERRERYQDADDLEPYPGERLPSLTSEELDAQTLLVERLVAAGRSVGHPAGHPFRLIALSSYSQTLRTALPQTLDAYRQALSQLRSATTAFAASFGLQMASRYADCARMARLADELNIWLDMPKAWAEAGNPQRYFLDVQVMAGHGEKAQNLRKSLLAHWRPSFLERDGAALLETQRSLSTQGFLKRLGVRRRLMKELRPEATFDLRAEDLGSELERLAAYQAEQNAADALSKIYGAGMDGLYQASGSDWAGIRERAACAQLSAQRLRAAGGGEDFRRRYAAVRELTPQIKAMQEAWRNLLPARQAFETLLEIRLDDAPDDLAQTEMLCQALREKACDLKPWIHWMELRKEAQTSGLQNVITAYANGLDHERILPAYHKMIATSLAAFIIDQEPSLFSFSGPLFHEKIEQMKRLDHALMELTRTEIYARLAARVPNMTREAAQSSEVGILQRAIRSGGRGISLRRLFGEIPNLLPRLCPCMLMSPISAAQYLDPKREPFDLVVFDEASQLPTCKAVGALARGKHAVIVGDPRQMPPTSFFASAMGDEEEQDTEDLESILDDCLALNMPQTHLLWHYRSRHESLIAFSNYRFYEHALRTFPSVNDRASKLRLVPVKGFFDRGGTRQNRAEAERIIQELQRRCHDPALSQLSVGVVTFNIPQQNLIEDLLGDACRTDPELERWTYDTEEAVFIKNLENVQGDERDVILFSVGYGPDETGRVSMNFGPLNREGGWRRLNVAISRSRCEMIVFSTLRAEQIDLGRSHAEGVAALRDFLAYAGGEPLPQDTQSLAFARSDRSAIAQALAQALRDEGYEIQLNVGQSACRIDLAVVDPACRERYILGVLLDGPMYAQARTTRDREIAQIAVLNGLGWTIHRIWSMDWWDNRQHEIHVLLAKLETLQEEKRASGRPREPEAAGSEAQTAPNVEIRRDLRPSVWRPQIQTYRAAEIPETKVSADVFLQKKQMAEIQKRALRVLEDEAPISQRLLTCKLLKSFGLLRSRARVQGRLQTIYRSLPILTTVQETELFFWRRDQDPNAYVGFRVQGEEGAQREAKDLPAQEAANALCLILQEQVGLAEEELMREAAKRMGYARLTQNVSHAFRLALDYAAGSGRIQMASNGNWILREGQG